MHLLAKFNLVLITVFALGLLAVCAISDSLLNRNAQEQVVENARIMMETASAMRNYTSRQIKPLLTVQMRHEFLPQSVPAYAATESFNDLRTKYPQYSYKEATLNPTNPRDRATDWENDVVTYFKNDKKMQEVTGVRRTPMGTSLYLAHPIRITDSACLTCHSTAASAPATMIKKYGPDNGFGWQMGDTVGAQIVSVPMALPERMANQAFSALLGSLITVFVITLIVLNLMMTLIVIRPVTNLSKVADEISRGNMDVEDLQVKGKDEIAGLAASFNRMQRSLKKAMAMLEEA
jgi:protein-histidine pros-kinase